MAILSFQHIAFLMAITKLATAQKTTIIPEDIRTGFLSGGTEVQVSYTDQAVSGFRDGTIFSQDAVSNEPTFALGDSSGITPSTLYTIIMVDTTCPNARKLHYARANFKNNFDITNIDTKSAPLMEYKAPGAFGEKGDNRQYTFLMYINPNRDEISELEMPEEGQDFDIKQFQDGNGLRDAIAGVGMVVKLGGEADCGGDKVNQLPSSLPTPAPAKSTTTAVDAGPTESAQEGASATATEATSASLVPSSTAGAENGSSQLSASSDGASDSIVATSSAARSEAPSLSTIISTAAPSSGGEAESPTATVGLPEQTANAAPALLQSQTWGFVPLMIAVGGLV